ncbi:MAG: cupin domain-containing protein [Hyphomicrobiaceae bacterium]|nr:cupin domain-containing protein [Hyphomicrobiaceae bacterium]MCC0024697.1 cupin domain-containing protein [Hyphomicrobiaceae bacterium]
MKVQDIIDALGLRPHPEGGRYRQTFEDLRSGGRAHSTAIYYLLQKGERSHWHRVDAAEVWHFYTGSPLALSISDGTRLETLTLGAGVLKGEQPQIVVPAGHWQSAESLGDWTLVGCTVAPGFQFEGFETAPRSWSPQGD